MYYSGTEVLKVPEDERTSITVNNLSVKVQPQNSKGQEVPILDEVSFELGQGNMMAIMGGSGSGKTTLLNVLAQRTNINSGKLLFSGSLHYGCSNTSKGQNISAAYMVQEDRFLPGLTLLETLHYQAELRLHSSTKEQQNEIVDTLLELLELDHRKNEIVMSFTNKINLSGGEQRRVSLAIQLLNKPQVLFLDEPTTGLDTSSALTLAHVLRKLASPEIGMTIVILIHQPRSEIAELFDKLCVLTRGGRQVFYGSLQESLPYFAKLEGIGLASKMDSSADAYVMLNRIMAMLVKDTTSVLKEETTAKLTDRLVKTWKEYNPVVQDLTAEEQAARFKKCSKIFKSINPLPFHREVWVLTKRTALISVRDKISLLSLLGGATVISFALGWMFFKPTPDLSGIRSINSSLYAIIEIVGFAPLTMEISRLWSHDGKFYFKEYREKCVSPSGFILSRRLAKFFIEDVPMITIFSLVTYFMWGLRVGLTYQDSGDVLYFFRYYLIVLLVGLVSMSTATLSFALSNEFSTSLLFTNILYQIQNSGSGFFVNSKTMPVYVRWVKYIAYFWYAFGGLASNQYTKWSGACEFPSGDIRCRELSGNYQLKTLGYPQNWVWAPIGYLCAWFVGTNALSILLLRYYKKYDVEMVGKKKNRIGTGVPLDESASSANSMTSDKDGLDFRSPSINVKNVSLAVKVKDSQNLFAKKVYRVLVDNISANFVSNSVNVIMGPSGSGKTTLLNLLADRLSVNCPQQNGEILLNDVQKITPTELSKISAYVTQLDNLLISDLTVRETLYYQAILRLPAAEHSRIPSIIDHLMRQTGLIDCADTPIGRESKKGISGGEKRRVSIAIQLLSRPKILFLDEPTSGLDSATSVAILHLLKTLASQGTTIVSTIHQPSKAMLDRFDSLTLLAKGGFVIYDGPVSHLPIYLTKNGYSCPASLNLADHILDLVSVQVNETKEDSQARVANLIKQWKSADPVYTSESFSGESVEMSKFKGPCIPWYIVFKAICERQFIVAFRDPDIIFTKVYTMFLLAIVYALFFAPLRNDYQGIDNRLGLIQSICNLYFVGLLNNLSLFPSQRNLFHQEYKDGTYGVTIFSAAYLIVAIPFEIIPSVFFSAMVVFVIGLPRTVPMFFTMIFVSFACVNCGESAGIFFNSIFTHMGLVTNVLSNLFALGIFMAGTMSLQMPMFFRAWNYLSPVKYVVLICVNMAFKGQKFKCVAGNCALSTGQQILETYHLEANVPLMFMALTICIVVGRAIAIASIYIRAAHFT